MRPPRDGDAREQSPQVFRQKLAAMGLHWNCNACRMQRGTDIALYTRCLQGGTRHQLTHRREVAAQGIGWREHFLRRQSPKPFARADQSKLPWGRFGIAQAAEPSVEADSAGEGLSVSSRSERSRGAWKRQRDVADPASERSGKPAIGPRAAAAGPTAGQDFSFQHSVGLQVAAPIERVWSLWTNLQDAPKWMRWIKQVEILDGEEGPGEPGFECPLLSRWVCSTNGFEVAWVARIQRMQVAPNKRVLQWASVEGLRSGGEVTFTDVSERATLVELSIKHSLPPALARVMNQHALSSLVEATLKSDLKSFEQYVAESAAPMEHTQSQE